MQTPDPTTGPMPARSRADEIRDVVRRSLSEVEADATQEPEGVPTDH
jgi:hypothetical protein